MRTSTKKESYSAYKEKVIALLVENRTWKCGNWRGSEKAHILPVEYSDDRFVNRNNRADAISHYLNLDCRKCLGKRLIGLHPYAHHLNSSQTLCMKFFSALVELDNGTLRATEEMVNFIKSALGIVIHVGAVCHFEYSQRHNPYMFDVDEEGTVISKYEGTNFDFHIQDNESPVEIFFEIKFTERGFNKEKESK